VISTPPVIRDIALLIGRLVLGTILVAHGSQKWWDWGITGTTTGFAEMGIPLPSAAAIVAATVELGGGVLLLVGLLTEIAGVLVALNMLGAVVLVHIGNGVFVENNGWELPGAIFTAALVLAAAGAGRFSVDGLMGLQRASHRHARRTGSPTSSA
jgi:putative oxidoreductase